MRAPQLYGDRVAAYVVSGVTAALWVVLAALAWGQCSDLHEPTPATVATPILTPASLILSTPQAAKGDSHDADPDVSVTPAGEQGSGSSASLLAPRPANVGSKPGVEATAAVGARAVASTPAPEPRVLTDADVLALLASSSWPESMHPWVLAVARCESGLEPGQTRGDGGLAWGLLSVRVDVHPHLAARFDLLDASGNLEAGWVVWQEREAIGMRGEDAWLTCSRRAAA